MQVRHMCTAAIAGLVAVTSIGHLNLADAQDTGPEMLNPALTCAKHSSRGSTCPSPIAFLDDDDLLVLEKNSGRVRRVTDGEIADTDVLDLGVNNASERGLLGIALHPDFPDNPGVYLYWTCRTAGPPPMSSHPMKRSASTRTCSCPTPRTRSPARSRVAAIAWTDSRGTVRRSCSIATC